MSETAERAIAGVGLLRYEEFGPGEWLTRKGEPAKIGKRRYSVDDEDYDAVSSIVGTLDKSGGLMRWAEDWGARGAVTAAAMGKLDGVPEEEIVKVVRGLGLGADSARDDAADRGKAVHTAFHTLATTGDAPKLGDYPEAWRPWIKGCARAWLKLDPEVIDAEFMVCDPELRYAGRPDLLCRSKGQSVLLDYKTGKGRIYEQAHYQTRGYVEAFPYCGINPPDRVLIVGIDDDGGVLLEDCEATRDDWLALLHTYHSRKRVLAAIATAKRSLRAAEKAQVTA